jgi:hypothetical protein
MSWLSLHEVEAEMAVADDGCVAVGRREDRLVAIVDLEDTAYYSEADVAANGIRRYEVGGDRARGRWYDCLDEAYAEAVRQLDGMTDGVDIDPGILN